MVDILTSSWWAARRAIRLTRNPGRSGLDWPPSGIVGPDAEPGSAESRLFPRMRDDPMLLGLVAIIGVLLIAGLIVLALLQQPSSTAAP